MRIFFVLCSLALLVFPANSWSQTCEATGGASCYYAAPGGSGTVCSYASPCRFRDAISSLSAGDYLYLLDGEYGESEIPETINGVDGTSVNPITIKNYPDQEPTLFPHATSPDSCARRSLMGIINSAYIIFDGIIFKHDCYYDCGGTDGCNPDHGKYQYMLTVDDSDHITFINSEIAGSTRYRTLAGIQIESSDYVTVENSYLHDFTPPTGDGGDGSDWEQGSGEAIYAFNSDFLLIKDNTVRRCNHACMTIGSDAGGNYAGPCKYAKITNNMVDARYGGGIYVGYANTDPANEMYSLIEGNVVVHAGDTTSKGKGGLFITGSRMSIRKNVVFSPSGGGLELSADDSAFLSTCPPYSSNNNLIYNNTIFGTGQGYAADLTEDGGYGLYMFVDDCTSGTCFSENNTFVNNIFYKSSDKKAWISSPSYTYKPELLLYLEEADSDHDWLDPDGTENWGGNEFHHNLIRKNDIAGETYSDLIIYGGPGYGNQYSTYNIAEAQDQYSAAWHDNIGGNPDIASEDPDSYGLAGGWWSVPEDSPAVNQGTVVNDTIGAEVESRYPGWGWGNLKSEGIPDIGAFEYGLDDPNGLPNVDDEEPGSSIHAGGCNINLPGNKFGLTGFLVLFLMVGMLICRKKMRKR